MISLHCQAALEGRDSPEIILSARNVAHNLRFERIWIFEFALVADALQKFDPDAPRRSPRERLQKKGLNTQIGVAAERRPISHVGNRVPVARGLAIPGSRDVDSPGGQHFGRGLQIESGDRLPGAYSVPVHYLPRDGKRPIQETACQRNMTRLDQRPYCARRYNAAAAPDRSHGPRLKPETASECREHGRVARL